ncbi:glycosyl hydrolase family 28-related protein [Mesobacillus harenae]|uniref:glycosyl hydrolase family 28-related protein n=1 Tax=Mesobacillus harenae TaxID=2213203 RepID=UPI001580B079|nr:glycosyl hydrolase family 28-related protein [Mesobacillus harenae]
MLYLDKMHDPSQNEALISQYGLSKLETKYAVKETDRLFQRTKLKKSEQALQETGSIPSFIKRKTANTLWKLLTNTDTQVPEAPGTSADEQGNVYPFWLDHLHSEYEQLLNEIDRDVNIEDYGAIGDGITDCTEAFKMAIGEGRVRVHIPEGTFITKGITLPSWTILVGEGKDITMIKLHDKAGKGKRLITNSNHWRGNHHISVEGMSLDWNAERLGNTEKTSTWGNHSSCLTFANVKYGWVKSVKAINAGLHCFDVSSTLYNYSGDGHWAKGPSSFVWLDNLNGYGFGDDGITTHHSENIFISNCHMCDPSGLAHKKGFSNSNGIEIDDGSRNVWLVNNSTARCFGGVEIKAHHNSSAAANVQIIGHLSINDNRSYNFRHIGHHKITDPESQTAYNILATNLIAIAPVHTDLYRDSTPRGLVVSAYKNVVINHFTAIGNPEYDYKSNPVIAIQYRARNVILNKVSIRNFRKAGTDIKVFGGDNKADKVKISNVSVRNSSPQAIHIGSAIQDAVIQNITAIGQNGRYAIKAENSQPNISKLKSGGYKVPVLLSGRDQITVE